jgi:signal transduction histidine kinase
MSTPFDQTSAFPTSVTRWSSWARLRPLFAGTGYAVAITLVIIVGWAAMSFMVSLMTVNPVTALRQDVFFFFVMLGHQMPLTPVVAVGVNLAPASGARRYAWLLAVVFVMWGFCSTMWWLVGEPTINTTYFLFAFLVVSACFYRTSAQGATSAFVKRQIEGAKLDSQLRGARLQLLRAQIEPHFLFNTLATVSTLARTDRPSAVEMLDNLMRYFSEALPKFRQEQSSLAQELELIDAYLRIYQIRMGERLSYELLIPEALRSEMVPSMLLLTLVENALKHGINPVVSGGSIRVTAAREPTALILKVSDTGQGLSATEGQGFGLANIQRRLSMLYGDGAFVSLAQQPSRGVIATVAIPLGAAH